MKTKKITLILEQIALFAFVNYLLLVKEGYLSHHEWKVSFTLPFLFLNLSVFGLIGYTFLTKTLLPRQVNFVTEASASVYLFFVSFLCLFNLMNSSGAILVNSALGLFSLFIGLVFLFSTYRIYKINQGVRLY